MVISPDRISEALDTAPAWALIALTVPQERLRDDARRELAEHVYTVLRGPVPVLQGQLALPL